VQFLTLLRNILVKVGVYTNNNEVITSELKICMPEVSGQGSKVGMGSRANFSDRKS